MKITLKPAKPRNPFVVDSLRRSAGSHRASGRSCRQQAQRALRREVDCLRPSP